MIAANQVQVQRGILELFLILLFLISTKLPILILLYKLVSGLIFENGPISQLFPILESKIFTNGLIKVFFPTDEFSM